MDTDEKMILTQIKILRVLALLAAGFVGLFITRLFHPGILLELWRD